MISLVLTKPLITRMIFFQKEWAKIRTDGCACMGWESLQVMYVELLRENAEYKAKHKESIERYDALNAKLEELAAYVHGRPQFPAAQPDAQSTPFGSENGQVGSDSTPAMPSNDGLDNFNSPDASPVNNQSFGTDLPSMRIKVGSYVMLKSLSNISETVATGMVNEMKNIRVNGVQLGPDFCSVVIQFQVQKDARSIFPHRHVKTIGSALGVPVAWPLSLVVLDDDQFHF